jgi:hypothetical protein
MKIIKNNILIFEIEELQEHYSRLLITDTNCNYEFIKVNFPEINLEVFDLILVNNKDIFLQKIISNPKLLYSYNIRGSIIGAVGAILNDNEIKGIINQVSHKVSKFEEFYNNDCSCDFSKSYFENMKKGCEIHKGDPGAFEDGTFPF